MPTALSTYRLSPGTTLTPAQPWAHPPVTLASPALEVMTDLTRFRAATIHADASLREAEQTMIYQGVRMLFVVTDMPSLEGLITTTDLRGETQMRLVHERGVIYDELCVADVMTPVGAIDAVDLAVMDRATVGDAIATLRRFGRNHLLVVEAATATSPRRVRGVISRAQIERQLGVLIDVAPIADSFSEIERALA